MAKNYDFKKSIPESTVLHSCLATLKYLGIYAWRNNTGAVRTPKGGFVQFGFKGSSDILGITHAENSWQSNARDQSAGFFRMIRKSLSMLSIHTAVSQSLPLLKLRWWNN